MNREIYVVQWFVPVVKVPVTINGREASLYDVQLSNKMFLEKENASAFLDKLQEAAGIVGLQEIMKAELITTAASDAAK